MPIGSGRLRLMFLLPVVFCSSVIACRTAPMNRPPAVITRLPPEDNHQVVLDALSVLHWTVESDEPGEVVARYEKGSYFARVRILYDTSGIQILYRDSQNLDCKPAGDGCSVIHKTYNRWVQTLYEGISSLAQAKR